MSSFLVPAGYLQQAVEAVVNATDTKAELSAFHSVKLLVSDKTLILSAYSPCAYVESKVPAELASSGQAPFLNPVSANARKFYELVSTLKPEKDVRISQENGNALLVAQGRSRFSLKTYNSASLPNYEPVRPMGEDLKKVFLWPEEFARFRSRIKNHLLFSAKEGLKPYVNTILFSHEKLVTTDLLSMIVTEAGFRVGGEAELIFSFDTMSRFISVFNGKGETEMIFDRRGLFVTTEDTYAWFNPLSCTFPDWEGIVREARQKELFRVEADEFAEELSRILILADDAYSRARLDFTMEGTLCIESLDNEQGQVFTEVDVLPSVAERFTINFNSRLLQKGLKTFRNEKLRVYAHNPRRPILLSGEHHDFYLNPLAV